MANYNPALTEENNFEFFLKEEGVLMCMENGKTFPWSETPISKVLQIREDLENHPKELKAMERMGIIAPEAQNHQWAICNFGDFDNHADITPDGIMHREHINCDHRGSCVFEGIICKPVHVENGNITEHMLKIIRLISKDKSDKEIAFFMGTKPSTVNGIIQKILNRLKVHSRPAIIAWASQNNLL